MPHSVHYYLDENGNKINNHNFQKKWREKTNNLARWDYVAGDSSRVARLFSPVYSALFINYTPFKHKLEDITGKSFPEDQIFLIEYTFEDDLCAMDSSNDWKIQKVKTRKRFTDINKEKIEKDSKIVVLNFFEESILLENAEGSPEEYYFTDSKNFLRNTLFINPTLCGSLGLIKPSGETLIRNGEYSTFSMAEHLRPQNWKIFFPEK